MSAFHKTKPNSILVDKGHGEVWEKQKSHTARETAGNMIQGYCRWVDRFS